MMRLSKIRKLFCATTMFFLPCISFFPASTVASQQIELRGGAVTGKAKTESGYFVNTEAISDGYYWGEFSLNRWLKLQIRDRFEGLFHLQGSPQALDAVTSASQLRPFSEKKIPSSNDGTIGLQISIFGQLVISQRLFSFLETVPLYIENDPDVTPFYDYYDSTGLSEFQLKRLSQSFTNLSYMVPIKNTVVSADFILQRKPSQILQFNYSAASDQYDSLTETSDINSTDLWSKFNVVHHFENGFYTGLETFLKNSLSDHTPYDLYRSRIYIGDTHELFSTNKFTWTLSEHWYESMIMRMKNYTTQLGSEIYMRDVWMFAYGWYVKGTFTARIADRLYKQRIEGSLRYATQNESSIEAGFFANSGGLFPTQGSYLYSNLNLTDRLNVSLNSKVVYEGPDLHIDKLSLLKWNIVPELSLTINDAFETFTGIDYTYYNHSVASSFPVRAAYYLGIRSVLP